MKKRILIVDDDLSLMRTLKLALEKSGRYEVREENQPRQAVAVAREFRPHLILLDVCMPELDGGDVALRCQADYQLRHVPILFLTSIVSDTEASSGEPFLSGGVQFLSKSAGTDRIIRHIENELAKPQLPARPELVTTASGVGFR